MKRSHILVAIAIPLALLAIGGGARLIHAQLDGADRGIAPIDSTSNFEVMGVEVDVRAASGEAARVEGWRRAQREGWRLLWSRTTGRPIAQAPNLSESVLNSIVSGIIIDSEQIGPTRYIARLGVLFDRARTGQMLGVEGLQRRSAAMLVIPVLKTGGSAYSFEFQNDWQRAWAEFRTAGSPIDYVRTSGTGIDPLLLNSSQTARRGRGWWRMILDQYGAADVLIAELDLRRLYPGGPALGIFTARFGPDGDVLGSFRLRADNGQQVRAMLDEGVRRLDALYTQALEQGRLRPDSSLVIIEPAVQREIEEIVPDEPVAAPVPVGPTTTFNVQVETPDAGSVQGAEVAVSRVGGVTSAVTTSLALGGTSVMRVTYAGDAAGFQAALAAQGWRVQVLGGNSVRISR